MLCAHCRVALPGERQIVDVADDREGKWSILRKTCSECGRTTMFLRLIPGDPSGRPARPVVRRPQYAGMPADNLDEGAKLFQIWPRGASRPPAAPEVPESIAADYNEACMVLPDSAKASAALSRRCLQLLLRSAGGAKPSDLAREI